MKNSVRDLLACVDLPALPLQLLLRRHPDWAAYPAAVVAEDKPQGTILWVNEQARRLGVLPGLRYAAAFSLASKLRAGVVSPNEIDKAIAQLTDRLLRFTPEVEPAAGEPGVFWLNGAGLKQLYRSPRQWGSAIQKDVQERGWEIHLAVGFTRFGTYAVAKAEKGITIFHDPAAEREAAQKIRLDRLHIDPAFCAVLFKLGIKTVGALLALPPGGLRERFGPKAHQLYRMAADDFWTPFNPAVPEEPVTQRHILDDAESDATRLLFLIKHLLHPMLTALAARAQALVVLRLFFLLDRSDRLKEEIRPAAPTLDAVQILDLVRLRLESLRLSAGVVEIRLQAEGCATSAEQLRLFTGRPVLSGVEGPSRDIDAANRALARLRAEFGEEAVVSAKLANGHLPEARFTWELLASIKLSRNGLNKLNPSTALRAGSAERLNVLNRSGVKALVRRIAAKPALLPGGPYHTHEDGWLLLGPQYGTVDKLSGPYIFSGGWWNRELWREYYFAETRRGDVLWLYYDRMRRRWFLQGSVE